MSAPTITTLIVCLLGMGKGVRVSELLMVMMVVVWLLLVVVVNRG